MDAEINITDNPVTGWQNAGLELLVSLAKKGEIDPWDVDLLLVIDKFLLEIGGGASLGQVAEIIFWVSVLLRIKSEHIYKAESVYPDYTDPAHDELDFDDFAEFPLEAQEKIALKDKLTHKVLDETLQRNVSQIRKPKNRQVTLEDLISLFQKAQQETKPSRRRQKVGFADFREDEHTEDLVVMREEDQINEVLDLAHEENLEEKIAILSAHILRILEPLKVTSFTELQSILGSKVDTFLSALFLSHSGKSELIQENFYAELWLKRLA